MPGSPITIVETQVPTDAQAPIIVDTDANAVRMAIVNRREISSLNAAEWSQPGVYVLCGSISYGKPVQVYVGKSGSGRSGPRGRLRSHHSNPKLEWWQAAIFKRHAMKGWNGAEIGYLEGRLSAELDQLPGVKLVSERTDIDNSLTEAQEGTLDQIVPVLLLNLRVLGLPLGLEEDAAPRGQVRGSKRTRTRSSRTKKRTYPARLPDLVASGELKLGEVFVYRRGKKEVKSSITAGGGMLVGGKEYTSPSAAAVAAYPDELKSAPGWDVWKQEQSPHKSLAQLRKSHLNRKARRQRASSSP